MPLTEGITSFFACVALEAAPLAALCFKFFFTGLKPGMAVHACLARWCCNKCLSAFTLEPKWRRIKDVCGPSFLWLDDIENLWKLRVLVPT